MFFIQFIIYILSINSDTWGTKCDELRSLKDELVSMIKRLFKVVDKSALTDLLSGKGRVFVRREELYYWKLYEEITTEEDMLAAFGEGEYEPTYFMDDISDYDDEDHEPIRGTMD